MSSLLEQAIIDATALKEAAVKNAETAILNKYSEDIRGAVESLLEQDEIATTPETPDLPLAGEPDASAPDDFLTLNLEELQEIADALAEEDATLIGNEVSHEALADGDEVPTLGDDEEVKPTAVDVALEEEINLEALDAVLEELIVDIDPVSSGWAGTPEPEMKYKEEMELAHRSSTEALEQVAALKDAVERLSEQNESLKGKNNKIVDAFKVLKENFDKVNLSNARLIYTNRILANDSLNERQKLKIVEALSNADSIDEAKVIFETLKSAVGSVTGKAHPQSLRETIERPSATLPRRAPARTDKSPAMDRFQLLAGIKKLD
mgnify:CR=1 FL=1